MRFCNGYLPKGIFCTTRQECDSVFFFLSAFFVFTNYDTQFIHIHSLSSIDTINFCLYHLSRLLLVVLVIIGSTRGYWKWRGIFTLLIPLQTIEDTPIPDTPSVPKWLSYPLEFSILKCLSYKHFETFWDIKLWGVGQSFWDGGSTLEDKPYAPLSGVYEY